MHTVQYATYRVLMAVTDPVPERLGRTRRMELTREQIIRAALDLAAEDPSRRLTAERIAERAGVSRRTFFNYFPSVEAAFYAPVQQLLHAAVAHLEATPADTPLLAALTGAVTAATAEEPLERLGRCTHLGARMPQFQGNDLEQWEVAESVLSEVFQDRYPHLDPFVARCLTGAVLGACRAAVQEWDRRVAGRFTDDTQLLLHDLIATALTHVATGFGAAVDSNR